MNVDWTPVTSAIVALIAVLISTFIPMAVKLFFEAWQAKLEKAKIVVENNQNFVNGVVFAIQQGMNGLTNSEKYLEALRQADAELHLPVDTLKKLIENAVGSFKLEWGKDWDALGGVTPPVSPPA